MLENEIVSEISHEQGSISSLVENLHKYIELNPFCVAKFVKLICVYF